MKKKEYRNYFIIGAIVLLIYILVTHFSNMFGSDTDWINQHTVIPEYFRQLFYETGNLFPDFSFNYGAGQNIFNLSYYGLFSPIILISYLFPFIDMVTYMTIANLIVVILSGILFYKWIKNNNYNDKIALVSSIIFILSESFIFHMHRHIMFVNYIPFLIMALMGVDKLFKENKKVLLIICTFLMIMTSYYYSVCGIIVLGVYYLYKYFSDNKNKGIKPFFIKGIKFVSFVFVAVLMAAILLLPTIYTLFSGRGANENSIDLISLFIPYLKFHKIFCGTYAIGLSMIGFISLLYLFYTKKKNNIIIGIILCIILFIPIFRYVLNGGLYLREKCFIPFMPLFGFYISYFLKDLFEKKFSIYKFTIYLSIILGILYFFNKNQYCYLYLIGFIIIILLFNKFNCKKVLSLYLVIAAFVFTIIENFNEDYVSIDEFNNIFNDNITESINNINIKDDSYYRINSLVEPTRTVNKIYNNNYFTTNIYSSTYNYNYLNFVRNEFKNSMIEYNYFMVPASNNLLFNTYMGVKYLYSDYDPGLGYEYLDNNIYVNNEVFPLFYATDNIISKKEYDNYSYPYNLEILLNNVVVENFSSNANLNNNINKVDLKYELINSDGVVIKENEEGFILEVEDTGFIKLKLDEIINNKILFINIDGLKQNSCSYDNISMKINNVTNILTCKSWIYPNKNNTFRYVISDNNIEELNIELSKGTYNINNINTYILDYNKIKDIKDDFDLFNITKLNDNIIKGNINVRNNSYFVTSIPYDKGFTVKVDNKIIEYEMVNNAFVGFPISNGQHNIEIIYNAPWYNIGKIISIIGFGLFGIIIFLDYKRKSS